MVPVQEGIWGAGGTSSHIANPGTRWRLVISFIPWLLHTQGKSLQHQINSLVGPDGLGVLEESKISCPCCGVNYSSLVTQTKALLLHRLQSYLSACYISPTKTYHIHSNARWGFPPLKFSAHLYGVILILCMKRRTGPQHIGSLCSSPCEDKARPALANHHVWTKQRTEHDWSYLTQSSFLRTSSII